MYAQIDEWRNRPLERSYPYLFVDGVWHKRTWGGSVENVSVLVAIGVDDTGHREVVGVAEGMKEDRASWEQFVRSLIERGLRGVRLVVGDRCAGLVATVVFCQIEVVQNGVSIQSEKAAGFSPVERKDPPPLLFGFYPIRAWVRLYDSPSNLIILP